MWIVGKNENRILDALEIWSCSRMLTFKWPGKIRIRFMRVKASFEKFNQIRIQVTMP